MQKKRKTGGKIIIIHHINPKLNQNHNGNVLTLSNPSATISLIVFQVFGKLNARKIRFSVFVLFACNGIDIKNLLFDLESREKSVQKSRGLLF